MSKFFKEKLFCQLNLERLPQPALVLYKAPVHVEEVVGEQHRLSAAGATQKLLS